MNIPTGCYFHPRCPVAVAECKLTDPPSAQVSERHKASCSLVK
ncbi:MAG: hypothetical protein M1282_07470 [Chloroflexi bacterium]|nr:hypothetical protein [Chloroflexota bacterium]